MTTTDFVMPKLGLTMTEGTISRWAVTPGSRFEAGDIILVVETDKIAYDVEAPASGILKEVLVSEGSVVPVGTPIGRWDVGDSKVSLNAPMSEAPAELPVAAPTSPESKPVPLARPAGEPERILATPYARRLAREAGIDLRQIGGSGPKGRIKAADVDRVITAGQLQTPPAVPAPVAHASRAAISIAGVDIDVTALLDLDDQIKSQLPDLRTELAHYVVLATSRLFDSFPEPTVIGLAPNRENAGGTGGIFTQEDCRTLRTVVAHSEKSTMGSTPSSLQGTLWVGRALDGISFFLADPPSGWSASINIGSVRDEFRPDANGRPIRARVVCVLLTWRAGEFDAISMQRLLSRVREMLQAPLVLLAS
jgi:pyruvate dehydrogenase E2 component (dihydrolipoyllysine-residue acetyltransferase)